MTADFFSLVDLGALMLGLVVVGAIIFAVSTSSDDPSGLSGFLRHKPIKTDAARRKRK
ncbi:hypothetical protein RLW55_03345 [Hyphomicrobium sp. B1]|jgi:hypothetical protein|uniref:hypothetical protein n=1 Tax=unclassified Hyphomicrobium TaxID=2619925 RepID=UPI0039C1FEE5